ncbi:hypothetical protein L6164_017024 [Bauhinia variegata]|uniref:Uncharacterized protein n=1 Tax=Bauhinia variegata TaxID=167791 RepID=A0ACB9N853_BAUVA|nr:hypothetical protein L6164_017024 [Bauhinia variegata]
MYFSPCLCLCCRAANRSRSKSKMISLQRLRHLFLPSKAIVSFALRQQQRLLPIPICYFSSLSSISKEHALESETANVTVTLTEEELTKINLLIPRLCDSNQLATAVRLTSTALLANPALKSLSISLLIDSLASQPDMTQTMSLLTHLKYTPNSHPYIRTICVMLISSYFKKYKYKEALKFFNWMARPDSPCAPDEKIYAILINGFCKKGFLFEALKVLRSMVVANMVPSGDSKEWVYRGLLKEARIKEAVQIKDALSCEDDEGLKRVSYILEQMITQWID